MIAFKLSFFSFSEQFNLFLYGNAVLDINFQFGKGVGATDPQGLPLQQDLWLSPKIYDKTKKKVKKSFFPTFRVSRD